MNDSVPCAPVKGRVRATTSRLTVEQQTNQWTSAVPVMAFIFAAGSSYGHRQNINRSVDNKSL